MEELGDPGLIVPPMTPFTADGDIDYDAYEAQIEYIVTESGATAVPLMAVEAQEYRCLDFETRQEAIRRGAEAIDGRVPVVVGASADSVDLAIDVGRVAAEVDAAALQLLIPRRPQGGDQPIEELIAFFERVSEALGLPIVAYHNPGPGADLSTDEMVELARSEAVIAFKESSRNLRHVSNLIERIDRAGLANYYTTMEMLLVTLQLGGSGATMPAPPAEIAAEILQAVQAGAIERAADHQRKFAEFPGPFLHNGFPTVMKAALDHVGVDGGLPYPPADPMDEAERVELGRELDEMGLESGP
ncbi:dihydrodipicolinate synthase family protein [Halobellus sp. GM3]|uniref:dihydrodipicolinate synthase family protein n=1 Tax=Halobellus sp. GM3 TaxID=3458410 RepID=UPI00403D5726